MRSRGNGMGKRGPIKKYTEVVEASITADADRKIRSAAAKLQKPRAALVREILDSWLQENQGVWQ